MCFILSFWLIAEKQSFINGTYSAVDQDHIPRKEHRQLWQECVCVSPISSKTIMQKLGYVLIRFKNVKARWVTTVRYPWMAYGINRPCQPCLTTKLFSHSEFHLSRRVPSALIPLLDCLTFCTVLFQYALWLFLWYLLYPRPWQCLFGEVSRTGSPRISSLRSSSSPCWASFIFPSWISSLAGTLLPDHL